MSDEPSAPDPLKQAADREVEETSAVARGEVPERTTAAETAAAEQEIDAAAGVTPPAGDGPVASVGEADPNADTVRDEPQAPEEDGSTSIGDADPDAATVREGPSTALAPVGRTDLTADEKTWGTVAHAAAALTLVGVPFGNVLGPLGVWLMKKDTSDWVARHALASLNFQITMSIAFIIALASSLAVIGFVLAPAVVIADIVYTIKAAIKAGDCEEPSYPDWSLKLVK